MPTRPEVERTVDESGPRTSLTGTTADEHLIVHRGDDFRNDPSSSGVNGRGGDDILEASTPFAGQTHMRGGEGDDYIVMDLTNEENHQGHHAYGQVGSDTFDFVNLGDVNSPVVGRIDDFDYSRDTIAIEGQEIDLKDLPANVSLPDGTETEVRVVEHLNPELEGTGLEAQQFLAIGDDVFYALEGARDLDNAAGPLGEGDDPGEERHFVPPESIDDLRSAETVDYVDEKNFVPEEEIPGDEDDLNLLFAQRGLEVEGTEEDDHMYGGKQTVDGDRTGGQEMNAGAGDDVVDGRTGNDTINGESGDDLLAGGLDNDLIFGGTGDDKLWGGGGQDTLDGGPGNDSLEGNQEDDVLVSSEGDDTLAGGDGDDTFWVYAPEDRNVSISEDQGEGRDALFVDGSFDMSEDAENVEAGRVTGDDDDTLIGNDSDNSLRGNAGDNVVNGGDGDDRIFAFNGDDTVIGGQGDDVMGGNGGADRFHFASGHGKDRINDFSLDEDFITFHEDVDSETVEILENDDGEVVIEYGEDDEDGKDSVHLSDVSTEEFREAASERDEEGDPVIRAAPEDAENDPQPSAPPTLEAPVGDEDRADASGEVLYDDSAFQSDEPGGYRYNTDDDVDTEDDGRDEDPEEDEEDGPENDGNGRGEDDEEDEEDPQPSPEEEDAAAGGGCFVATAAYGDRMHPDVVDLRLFRETVLRRSFPGRAFIAFYWRVGPVLARYVRPDALSGRVSRRVLSALVAIGRRIAR